MSHMCTFNIGDPGLLSDMLFLLLWQLLCTQNSWLHAQIIQSIPLLCIEAFFTTKLG